MRILYHAPIDLTLAQGHAVHARRLADALEARGHVVHLISLASAARPSAFASEWSGPSGGWTRVARRGPPKLGQLDLEWRLRGAMRRQSSEFRPDLLLVRQELFSIAPLRLPRRTPLVVESNGAITGFARLSGASRWRAAAAGWCEEALLREADAIGVVSPSVQSALGLDHDARVRVIPNGVWLPPLSADPNIVRAEVGALPDEFVIVFAGNLSAVQGLGRFLAALDRMGREYRCWVVGEGVERARLEREHVQRSVFLGPVSEERCADLVGAAQLVVAPYGPQVSSSVGLDSLKLLQAFACDRPILVSSSATSAPLKEWGVGERLPADDMDAWMRAIVRWRERWVQAGQPLRDWPWTRGTGRGRKYVESERTWDHTATAWEAVFEEAISEAPR